MSSKPFTQLGLAVAFSAAMFVHGCAHPPPPVASSSSKPPLTAASEAPASAPSGAAPSAPASPIAPLGQPSALATNRPPPGPNAVTLPDAVTVYCEVVAVDAPNHKITVKHDFPGLGSTGTYAVAADVHVERLSVGQQLDLYLRGKRGAVGIDGDKTVIALGFGGKPLTDLPAPNGGPSGLPPQSGAPRPGGSGAPPPPPPTSGPNTSASPASQSAVPPASPTAPSSAAPAPASSVSSPTPSEADAR